MSTTGRAGVLGGVGGGLPGGGDDRGEAVVEGRLAHVDQLDVDAVRVLDLADDPAERSGQRAVAGGPRVEQPGPQVPLLRAGEPGHRRGVGGVLLDQGQGLQHGVVEVGGEVGTLLGTDPLGAFRGQVAGEPPDPGSEGDRQADAAERRRDQHVGDLAEVAVPDGEQRHRPDDQREAGADTEVRRPAAAAEDGTDRVEALGLVEPARPLRLVRLPPEQPEADHREHQRPDHQPVAEDGLGREHQPDAERHQRDGRAGVGEAPDATRAPPLAGGGLEAGRLDVERRLARQHEPQPGVEQDPAAAEHRRHQERGAYPHHRNGEVTREPGRDPADDRLAGVARGAAYVADGQGGAHGSSIVAEHPAPDHEERPRSTPDPDPGPRGADQGSPRWCTTCRWRRVEP